MARYDGSPTLLQEETIKREVCNRAIEENLVTPYDIIDPSYANSRLEEIMQGTISTKNSENNQIANTITTAAPNFGVCVPTENSEPVLYQHPRGVNPGGIKTGIAPSITTSSWQHNHHLIEPDKINVIGNYSPSGHEASRIVHPDGVAPTVKENHGTVTATIAPQCIGGVGEKKSNGGRQYYQQDRIYDDGIAISVTTAFNPYYATKEPRIIREEPLEREGWHEYAKEVLSTEGVCRTLSTQSNNLATKIKEPQSLRIRKLTPKECWRLMGFADEDVEKASKVCSNSQLYKQAGNSIVVDVLMAIFKELFVPKKTRSQWLDDLLNN